MQTQGLFGESKVNPMRNYCLRVLFCGQPETPIPIYHDQNLRSIPGAPAFLPDLPPHFSTVDGPESPGAIRRAFFAGLWTFDAEITPNGNILSLGGCGVVFRSTDKGQSWMPYTVAPGTYPLRIDMYDDLKGTIVGQNGVYHTLDGGITWTEDPSPQLIGGREVEWVTDSIAYISSLFTSLWKTNDAGATWFNISPLNSGAHITDLAFRSPTEGVIVWNNGSQHHTDDGGQTWTDVSSFLYDFDVVRYAPGGTCHGFGPSNIYGYSTDGGKVWTVQPNVPAEMLNVSDAAFPSDSTGYAYSPEGRLFKTEYAGQTWIAVTTLPPARPVGPARWPIEFASEDEGYIFEGNSPLYTQDGAVSTTFLATDTLPARAHGIQDVFALTDDELWLANYHIFDQRGRLIHSTNGGVTWEEAPLDGMDNIFEIDFLSPDSGFVGGTGTNGMNYTTDGGQTWVANPEFAGMNLAVPRLGFSPSGNFGLATTYRQLYRTADRGQTWTFVDSIPDGVSYISRTIKVASDQVAYLRVQDTLHKTTDAGLTWSHIYVLPPNAVWNFDITSEQEVFVGKDSSQLAVSTDGGMTWTTRPSNLDPSVIAELHFSDPLNGVWLDGTAPDNSLRVTNDGGFTWNKIDIFSCSANVGLTVPSANRLYLGVTAASLVRVDNPFPVGNPEPNWPASRYTLSLESGQVIIRFPQPLSHSGTAALMDVQGRILTEYDLPKGRREVTIELLGGLQGLYVLRLRGEDWEGAEKIMVG